MATVLCLSPKEQRKRDSAKSLHKNKGKCLEPKYFSSFLVFILMNYSIRWYIKKKRYTSFLIISFPFLETYFILFDASKLMVTLIHPSLPVRLSDTLFSFRYSLYWLNDVTLDSFEERLQCFTWKTKTIWTNFYLEKFIFF